MNDLHRTFGFIFFIVALIIVTFGVIAQFMKYGHADELNTNLVQILDKIHKWGGFAIIGAG